MQLTTKRSDQALVVFLDGPRLDATVAEEFKKQMSGFIDSGERFLVLNMKNLDFIDSTGMTAIVSILKKITPLGGAMAICEINDRLFNLFHLTKLDKVFTMCPTEGEALSKVEAGST